LNSPRRDNKNLLRIPEKTKNKGIITHFWIKYRKELIAGAIAVLVAVLILIITGSGSTAQNDTVTAPNKTAEIPVKIYSAGGIYLEYPASWNVTTDKVNGTTMEIVIQDPSSANNPDSAQLAAFTILKLQKEPYQTLEQGKDRFIQSLIISGANIAPTNTTNKTVAGINATETIYRGNSPEYKEMQLKLIYFEENNIIYILAFLTRGTDLQSQAPYFDMILNSFKLQ
jgi:hypothetical protein